MWQLSDDELFSTISAALFAGADFQGLHVDFNDEEVPFLRYVPLYFKPPQWRQLEQFFPPEKNQWPTDDVAVGELFLYWKRNRMRLSLSMIKKRFEGGLGTS